MTRIDNDKIGTLLGRKVRRLHFEVLNLAGRIDFRHAKPLLEFEGGSHLCIALGPQDDEIVLLTSIPAFKHECPITDWFYLRSQVGAVERYELVESPLVAHLRKNSVTNVITVVDKNGSLEKVEIQFGAVSLRAEIGVEGLEVEIVDLNADR